MEACRTEPGSTAEMIGSVDFSRLCSVYMLSIPMAYHPPQQTWDAPGLYTLSVGGHCLILQESATQQD